MSHPVSGNEIRAYCKDWEEGVDYRWCFFDGGLKAAGCPGATKAAEGDFYWTKSTEICPGE